MGVVVMEKWIDAKVPKKLMHAIGGHKYCVRMTGVTEWQNLVKFNFNFLLQQQLAGFALWSDCHQRNILSKYTSSN